MPADSSTTTALGNFSGAVVVQLSTRSAVAGMPHGGVAVGGATRGEVAPSSVVSQLLVAQSRAAPGRAGTSQRTLGGPPTVRRLQRVVPYGVTATASSTSSVVGSAEVGGAEDSAVRDCRCW